MKTIEEIKRENAAVRKNNLEDLKTHLKEWRNTANLQFMLNPVINNNTASVIDHLRLEIHKIEHFQYSVMPPQIEGLELW